MKYLFFLFIIILNVSCNKVNEMYLNNNISVYDKNIDFGVVPFDFYSGCCTDYSFGQYDTTSEEIYNKFDELLEFKDITKDSIGIASNNAWMYLYKFTSPTPEFYGDAANKRKKNKLKFIIICGQHGFEKSSIYGAFYFLKDICLNYMKSNTLKYFHQYSDVLIIPCANPYGIDNNIYLNTNGVNLNRNWPVENWRQSENSILGSPYYAGIAGGDQPEVNNIMQVLFDNKDAIMVLDFHTKGSGIQEKGSINWLSMTLVDDFYRDKLVEIGNYHLCNITSAFESMYSEELGNSVGMCGYMDATSSFSTTGYLSTYAAQQGFLSITFEGFNGFPNDIKTYSDNVKKANSELLGNYLVTLCYILSRF